MLRGKITVCYGNHWNHTQRTAWATHRAGPRQGMATGSLIVSRPLKPTFFKLFSGLGHGRRNFPRAGAQNAEHFRKNSFARGNLKRPAPYFRLFQRRLSATGSLPGSLVP